MQIPCVTGTSPLTYNIHDMSDGQMLTAAKQLGLGDLSQYVETDSINLDGSPVTMEERMAGPKIDWTQLFSNDAAYEAKLGLTNGVKLYDSLGQELVSHSDGEGNLVGVG